MPLIENLAQVVALEGAQLRLTTTSPTGCARCDRGEGCGGGVFGKLIQRRLQGLLLEDPGLKLQPGQLVVIGLDTAVFLQATVLIYLFPIGLLLLFAAGVQLAGLADVWIATGGVAGLCFGGVLAPELRRQYIDSRIQPRILRRALPADTQACQSF